MSTDANIEFPEPWEPFFFVASDENRPSETLLETIFQILRKDGVPHTLGRRKKCRFLSHPGGFSQSDLSKIRTQCFMKGSIRKDQIRFVKYFAQGCNDATPWIFVFELETQTFGVVYVLFEASCCFTGFGVAGGAAFYVSPTFRELRCLCMGPAVRHAVDGGKLLTEDDMYTIRE